MNYHHRLKKINLAFGSSALLLISIVCSPGATNVNSSPVSKWVEQNGLAVAIRLSSDELKPGQTLHVTLFVKNTGTNAIAIYEVPSLWSYFVIRASDGSEPTNTITKIVDPAPPNTNQFVRLKPGQTCSGEITAELFSTHDYWTAQWNPKYLRLAVRWYDYDVPPGKYSVRLCLREFEEKEVQGKNGWIPFEKAFHAKHWTGEIVSAPLTVVIKAR